LILSCWIWWLGLSKRNGQLESAVKDQRPKAKNQRPKTKFKAQSTKL
jgi:hypothetical protein